MRLVDKCPRVRNIIIHPFVFPIFPILSLYVNNMQMASWLEACRAVSFLLVCAVLLWLLVDLAVKNRYKSAIIVSALAMLFFAYGYALLGLTNALVRLQWLDRARFLVEGASCHILWSSVLWYNSAGCCHGPWGLTASCARSSGSAPGVRGTALKIRC